jgi:hypothetical protein
MDSAPAKREFAIALLQESSVFIHLDPRRDGVIVPSWLKRQPQLVLQIGLNMAVRIPDLDIGEEAVCCTLSFNRSPFFCRLPWTAVFGLVGEDGRGRIWPEDVPIEIATQMQQQAAKDNPKEPSKPLRQQGRARLQAIKSVPPVEAQRAQPARSDEPSAAGVSDNSPPVPSPQAVGDAEKPTPQPVAGKSARPSSAPGGKRELPSYLRVVK